MSRLQTVRSHTDITRRVALCLCVQVSGLCWFAFERILFSVLFRTPGLERRGQGRSTAECTLALRPGATMGKPKRKDKTDSLVKMARSATGE